MTFPYASKTAARLTSSLSCNESTLMERTIARHDAIQRSNEKVYRRIFVFPRSSDCSDIRIRLPRPNWRETLTELCHYRCGCGTELVWAYVDGKLDGGPECPRCMAPYWEAWRRVLHRITSYAVGECRRKAEELKVMSGSAFSVDAILAGIRLEWNPGCFTWWR